MISQRDIVEVPFNLQQGIEHHPAIVLSANEAILDEGAFIALMLTTRKHSDLYTFEITSEMLTKPLSVKYCEARLHLISFFEVKHIIRTTHYNSKVKSDYFNELIKQVYRVTFGMDSF